MFSERSIRNRKLVTVDCKSLLTEPQKFKFSSDGQLVAVGSSDGCRISVLNLVENSKKSLCEAILACICYRGFFSTHIKSIDFSADKNFLCVACENGKISFFHIEKALKAKNNLKTVRKYEIKSCLELSMD